MAQILLGFASQYLSQIHLCRAYGAVVLHYNSAEMYLILLQFFVDVEFWHNFIVECRQDALNVYINIFLGSLTPLKVINDLLNNVQIYY